MVSYKSPLFHVLIFSLVAGVSFGQAKLKGTYNIKITPAKSYGSSIECQVYDAETGEPLVVAFIKIDKEESIQTDTTGHLRHDVAAGRYAITALAYPYHSVTIESLLIKKGETTKVNFYLPPNNTPLID